MNHYDAKYRAFSESELSAAASSSIPSAPNTFSSLAAHRALDRPAIPHVSTAPKLPSVTFADQDMTASTSASSSRPVAVPSRKPGYPGLGDWWTQDALVKEHDSDNDDEAVPWSPALAFLTGINSPSPRSPAVVTNRAPPEDEPEPTEIGAYKIGEVIAKGTFSVVKKAFSNGGVVAVKVVRKTLSTAAVKRGEKAAKADDVEHETEIWSGLSHQNILPLFSTTSTPRTTYLFTLYCASGSLLDILNRAKDEGHVALPQDDVGTMFRQVVKGLRYLHEEARIIHRDIKLENILVDEMGACRISDFGLAVRMAPLMQEPSPLSESPAGGTPLHERATSASNASTADLLPCAPEQALAYNLSRHLSLLAPQRPGGSFPRSKTRVGRSPLRPVEKEFPAGSLEYASPELLTPSNSNLPPTPAQDIWALGCLLHGLLFGALPFVDNYPPRLQMKILLGAWEQVSKRRSKSRGGRSKSRGPNGSGEVRIGKEARGLLRSCLQLDLNLRWTIAQVDEMAWGVGWGEVEMEQAEPEPQQRVGRSKRKKNRRQQDGDYDVDFESRPGTTTASPRREQSPEAAARAQRKRSRSRQPLASYDSPSQSHSQNASASASRNHSRVRAHSRTQSGTGFFSKVTPGPSEPLAPETTLSSASMHAPNLDEGVRFASTPPSRGHSRRGSRNQSLTRSSSRPGSSNRSPSVPRFEADYENSPSIASSIQTPLSDQPLPQPALATRSRRQGSSPSPPRSRVPQTPTDEEQPHFAFPPGSAPKGRSVSRGRTRVHPATVGMGIGITGQFGAYGYERLEIVDESSAPVAALEDPFGRGRGTRVLDELRTLDVDTPQVTTAPKRLSDQRGRKRGEAHQHPPGH